MDDIYTVYSKIINIYSFDYTVTELYHHFKQHNSTLSSTALYAYNDVDDSDDDIVLSPMPSNKKRKVEKPDVKVTLTFQDSNIIIMTT